MAVVAVGSVIAASVGTARAMFLSGHDYTVVLWVCVVAGLVSTAFAEDAGVSMMKGLRDRHGRGHAGRHIKRPRRARNPLGGWRN